MKGRAVITGADGGMGSEITKSVAAAGYEVVMLCYDAKSGEACRNRIAGDYNGCPMPDTPWRQTHGTGYLSG